MSSLSSAKRKQISQWLLTAITIWAISVAIGSYFGFFSIFPLPWFAFLVALGIMIPVTTYYANSTLRVYVQGLHLDNLTLFHVWRIPAALTFFYYGSQNLLPQLFVLLAAWGDLLEGLLGLSLIVLPKRRWKYWGFHLFGFADFITAVGTGLTFSFLQVPAMATIATFPVALIPLFGVGISGSSHIIAINLLVKGLGKVGKD